MTNLFDILFENSKIPFTEVTQPRIALDGASIILHAVDVTRVIAPKVSQDPATSNVVSQRHPGELYEQSVTTIHGEHYSVKKHAWNASNLL